jgi:cytochrome c oxidase subunit III
LGLRLQRAWCAGRLHPAKSAAWWHSSEGSHTLTVTLLFLAVVGAVIAWWLAHQRLTSKPWLEEGVIGEVLGAELASHRRAKTGLLIFLAVAGCLFALFISAYLMRMGMADWWALPLPEMLWVNTGLLVTSSVALQGAQVAVHRGQVDAMRSGLLTGCASALAFLVGQLLAWRELATTGYGMTDNPANSFFYLISGVHGLHVAGGLVALGRATARAWREPRSDKVGLSIELCATYWHFMLVVWLVLFGLLAGWANDFADICRQILS